MSFGDSKTFIQGLLRFANICIFLFVKVVLLMQYAKCNINFYKK